MNQNARFYALIGIVLVVVGGMFYLIRGKGSGGDSTPAPVTAKKAVDNSREAIEAPAITSTRRDSRLTATASRASAPRESSTSSAKTGVFAVSGQVILQADESPVDGADVAIYWTDKDAAVPIYDDEAVWKTRTNFKGLYRVDKLPASNYVVIATKDDLAAVGSAYINPRETEDNVVSLALRPVGAISGHVLNEKREPVPNALVALGQGKRGQRDIYAGNTQTKSAPDGSFALNFIEEGTWTIQAKADGYAVGEVGDLAQNAQDAVIVLKNGGSVSGSVVSTENAKPVPNVTLIIGTSDGGGRLNRHELATDTDGKFVFKNLADGAYSLALNKQPYIVSGQVQPIIIDNAKNVENVQLNVVMGGTISGRATDAETGAPIANMAFRAQMAGGNRSLPAETDEDGIYRLEGLQAGQYTVRRMWMAGYRHGEDREDKSATVALGQEVTGIDFAVPPGLYLRGRVVDKDGEPLALVSVTSVDAKDSEGESMTTDEKGRWVHRGFTPGTVVTITADKSGYSAPPMENVTIPDHDLNDIEIVMDTGASIAGVIVDKAGNPLEDVYVNAVAVNPTSQSQGQQTAWSREGGKFKVQGLEEGTYKLQARPPRSWGQMTPTGNEVRVGKGEDVTGVNVVVDFDVGSKIAGRVVDSSGKPIKNANVNAWLQMGGGGGGDDQSDEDGQYEIVGLQPGLYQVGVYHSNYTNLQREQVEAPNPNFNITLRGKATIQGRVLEARSGHPIKTFSIVAMSGQVERVDPGNFWGNNGQTFVDDQGKFEILADDGGASLYVQSQGYAPAVQKVPDAKEGQTKSGVEIRLEAGGVIEGTVTTKTGERVGGAKIYTGRAPMGDWEVRERPAAATTDDSGSFRIESLAAQETRLFAVHSSYATASASATPSAGGAPTVVQITMGSGGSVSGTVRADGKPAVGYGVSLYYQDGGYQNNVEIGSNGEYSFTGLPEGTASLNVYGNQGGATRRNVSKQAVIVADQVTTVDFDIVEGTAVLEGTVTRDGQPVSGAYINVVFKMEGENQEGANSQTDAKGAFRFDGLAPGPAKVMFHINVRSASGQQMRSFQVELANDQTTRLDANLDEGARVSGSVTGVPQGWRTSVMLITGAVEFPEGANLQTMYQGLMDRMAGGAEAAADGSFQIEGAQEGEYTVAVIAFDPQSGGQVFKQATAQVTVSENGEANVALTLP